MAAFISAFMITSCSEPSAPQFEYKERILTDDLRPYGLAFHEDMLYFTSPTDNVLGNIELKEMRVVERFDDYQEPRRLNSVGDELFIGEFATNRVATRIGKTTLYYPLVEQIDGAMAASFGKSKVAIADYNKHRIVYYRGSDDLSFGEQGSEPGQFHYPTDVQIFGNKIYIADNMNRRVQVFDFEGQYVRSIGEGSGLKQASGVYAYSGGVLVCDRKGKQVIHFDHQGTVLQVIDQGFETPSDAVVIASKLYVADEEGGYIAVLEL